MKRLLYGTAILIFLAGFTPAAAIQHWDYPRYLVEHSGEAVYSEPRFVTLGPITYLFFLEEEQDRVHIRYFLTDNFRDWGGPFQAVGNIEKRGRFTPHYDVLGLGGEILVAWNGMDGSLNTARSVGRGTAWRKRGALLKESHFCFRPRLYQANGTVFLLYHTESEGRKIDFRILRSENGGRSWNRSGPTTTGFAGSFFPRLLSHRGILYLVWQSRQFLQHESPLFTVYLSTSSDAGRSWTIPKALTDPALGESRNPLIFRDEGGLFLLYEGDRSGTTRILVSRYDTGGGVLGGEVPVSEEAIDASLPRIVHFSEGAAVFYLDGRDGSDRLYYSQMARHSFEIGPLGRSGDDILHYEVLRAGDTVYLCWTDGLGIVLLGPDVSVPSVHVNPLTSSFIGTAGMEIGWERLEDSSGLEGYCYSFSQDESNEPELVNLSPEARGIFLASSEEGVHYLHIRAKDRVGNYSKTLTIPLTVDLTPPPKPSIIPLPLSEDGYYEHNSPVFRWTTGAHDTMGYNYRLTREQEAIESSAIRTIEPIAPFTSIGYGQWHFNVAAIDRAGNVGETAHFSLRLQSLAEGGSERVDTASETPTYSMERRSASSGPLSRSALYFVIGGNLIIALFIISQVLFRRQAGTQQPRRGLRRGLPMWKMGFGLRTKFSLLIVALVLVLTVGISSIVNTVNTTNQRKTLADQMLDKALLMLENMTNIAREGILNDDELLLMSLIAKTMENEDVTFSAVLDPHGKVIAHSDIERIGTVQTGSSRSQPASARELLIEPAYDPDNLEEAYELAAPVIFSGEWIGSVWLGYSTESISRTMEAQRRTNFYGTLIITALTVLIGITGAVAMATLTIRPIQTLTESARTIGEGNLDHRIHIASRDELGVLSDEFNRMTARLVEYQRKIEKQAKFDEQLEIARRIQQDLIPRAGIRDESVIIDGFYRPARGIGGDYYDFFPVSENKIGIIMSDVAGKGVPAALMMIMIRTIFMSLVHSGIAEPARMVTLLNDTLSSSMAGDRFATLLFGVYDLEGPEFKYTNAGYGPLLVYRKTEDACTLIESSNGSFPVGIMPEADYSNERPISFKTGDVLYLFTDGITEARNEKNEEYGLTRLLEILPGFSKQAPGEIIQSVVADLSRFVGDTEQFDDMSIAILQVRDGIQPT